MPVTLENTEPPLAPQQYTSPVEAAAHVVFAPAPMSTKVTPVGIRTATGVAYDVPTVLSPISPYRFSPQQ